MRGTHAGCRVCACIIVRRFAGGGVVSIFSSDRGRAARERERPPTAPTAVLSDPVRLDFSGSGEACGLGKRDVKLDLDEDEAAVDRLGSFAY